MIEPPAIGEGSFSLPMGFDWIPVPRVFELLEAALDVRVKSFSCPLAHACGHILAEPIFAKSFNPPYSNSAIDGYGFAGFQSKRSGSVRLKLLKGRAAAGHPFKKRVPHGYALRVLTGAVLPEGIDTIVLQEDVNIDEDELVFRGPLKIGKNTRLAGEDIKIGQLLFEKGHILSPPDLAALAAGGVRKLSIFTPLRVGVLSTGDELIEGHCNLKKGQIYDANRQMLLAQIECAGFQGVDLGIAKDSAEDISGKLDEASKICDAVVTTGGASAGDEDHVAALLSKEGTLKIWRIAVKPGRPMAMGIWKGLPIFGLPGNPVAAFICALVFAQPSLRVLGGGKWCRPKGYVVPAAFSKSKKPGRYEYLRARLTNGTAEVFHSEGSGRSIGLSWARGLVELQQNAQCIRPIYTIFRILKILAIANQTYL